MVNEKKRDLVDRNAVLDRAYLYVMDGELAKMIDERAVIQLPKVDAVEVVRCRDCKYRYTAKSGLVLCTQHITMTPKNDDFCSYGERR